VCGNDGTDATIRCRNPTCSDRVSNGLESDVDCGYGCCLAQLAGGDDDDAGADDGSGTPQPSPAPCPALCSPGLKCTAHRDCASGRCVRLPRLDGDRVCAATRPTDLDSRLTTRMQTAFRLWGVSKGSFNHTAFWGALSLLLDVPPWAILIEGLREVQREPEWGPGAFGDVVAANAAVIDARGARRLQPSGVVSRRRDLWPAGWATYYITASDTVLALDAYVSVFTQPSEGTLIASRLVGVGTNGTTVAVGGWAYERALARRQREASLWRQYCLEYVNATTVWQTNITRVNCSTYAATAIPWSLPAVRRLGDGSEAAVNLSSLWPSLRLRLDEPGETVINASLPRWTMLQALAPYMTASAVVNLENVTFDALYDPPDAAACAPAEVLAYQPPLGVPHRPITSTLHFPIQPSAVVVDRHDRGINGTLCQVRVRVQLVRADGQPVTPDVKLTGVLDADVDQHGIAAFSELAIGVNATGLRLLYTATWLDRTTAAPRAVNATTPYTFDVQLLYIPPVIEPERVPLHPALVALIFFTCVGAIGTVVHRCVTARRARMAAAKVHADGAAAAASGTDSVDRVAKRSATVRRVKVGVAGAAALEGGSHGRGSDNEAAKRELARAAEEVALAVAMVPMVPSNAGAVDGTGQGGPTAGVLQIVARVAELTGERGGVHGGAGVGSAR